jgi:hypothetical protein
MKNLKHQNYNRIRSIILNPKNNFNHIVSIGNLVRNFENTFGINSLSLRLNELKTDYIKTL